MILSSYILLSSSKLPIHITTVTVNFPFSNQKLYLFIFLKLSAVLKLMINFSFF